MNDNIIRLEPCAFRDLKVGDVFRFAGKLEIGLLACKPVNIKKSFVLVESTNYGEARKNTLSSYEDVAENIFGNQFSIHWQPSCKTLRGDLKVTRTRSMAVGDVPAPGDVVCIGPLRQIAQSVSLMKDGGLAFNFAFNQNGSFKDFEHWRRAPDGRMTKFAANVFRHSQPQLGLA